MISPLANPKGMLLVLPTRRSSLFFDSTGHFESQPAEPITAPLFLVLGLLIFSFWFLVLFFRN